MLDDEACGREYIQDAMALSKAIEQGKIVFIKVDAISEEDISKIIGFTPETREEKDYMFDLSRMVPGFHKARLKYESKSGKSK